MTRLIAMLFAALLALPAQAASDADMAALVKRSVEGSIVPAHDHLAEQSGAMAKAVDGYCATPDQAGRDRLATGFAELVEAWAGADFFRFGPMASDGRYERLAFWPDPHGTGQRQLRRFLATRDETLLAPGAIAKQSAAVQGMPALESLLFSGDDALVKADPPEAYRCGLAAAIAGNIASIARDAQGGWSGPQGWTSLIENPGPDNPVYRTQKEAVTDILKALLLGLEQMRDHRLVAALGATPDEGDARRAPYALSGNALSYMRASAEALRAFAETADLASLLPPDAAWTGGAGEFEFANLKRALGAEGGDLGAQIADPEARARLAYAAIVLASLRDIFQNRIAPAAGLSPGFNALDGD